MAAERIPRLATSEGTSAAAFDSRDWGLLLVVALIWGSSFLWIAIGLDSMSAPAVAFLRVALGGLALALYRPARRPVDRHALPIIALVGLLGNAGPALLFAVAQQSVESSVAGMINAATPLAVLVFSIAMLKRSPGPKQVWGLLIGFVGVAFMAAPSVVGANAQPVGVLLLLLAVCGHGFSNNLVVPLQQAYGAAPVIMRAQLIGAVALAPWGLPETIGSRPTTGSIAAVAFLGIVGTGIARALSATLIGRTGASRAALITYLIPIVAIILGVLFRNETIEAIEIAGTVVVLGGAFLTTRSQRSSTRPAG